MRKEQSQRRHPWSVKNGVNFSQCKSVILRSAQKPGVTSFSV